jgi:hypothetical protein
MSDDRLLDARNRAVRAQALVDDPLLKEGFDALEAAYIAMWRATRPEDQNAREKLYLAVNVIGKLREHLQSVIANGRLADSELNALTQEQERRKRFGII